MANPGNSDHTGYRMARVVEVSVDPEEQGILLRLTCGHRILWKRWWKESNEEYAAEHQGMIGKRQRCEAPHEGHLRKEPDQYPLY